MLLDEHVNDSSNSNLKKDFYDQFWLGERLLYALKIFFCEINLLFLFHAHTVQIYRFTVILNNSNIKHSKFKLTVLFTIQNSL